MRRSGPATRTRPPATAPPSCSTRGWRAPRPGARVRAQLLRPGPRPRRPRHLPPPAVGLDTGGEDLLTPDVRARIVAGAAADVVRGCRRAARLGPAVARPVAGDDHAAARLHPVLPGRPDADGNSVEGASRSSTRRRRARRPAPGAPQAVRAGREAPAQARLRGPRPEEIRNRPKQPYRAPDTASFFAARPPEWSPRSPRRARCGPGSSTRAGRRAVRQVRAHRRLAAGQHRQHARARRGLDPAAPPAARRRRRRRLVRSTPPRR